MSLPNFPSLKKKKRKKKKTPTPRSPAGQAPPFLLGDPSSASSWWCQKRVGGGQEQTFPSEEAREAVFQGKGIFRSLTTTLHSLLLITTYCWLQELCVCAQGHLSKSGKGITSFLSKENRCKRLSSNTPFFRLLHPLAPCRR